MKKIFLSTSIALVLGLFLILILTVAIATTNLVGHVTTAGLNFIGHKASDITIDLSTQRLLLHIGQLQISDQIKDIQIENLNLEVDFNELKSQKTIKLFHANRLSYREVIQPTASLKKTLQQIRPMERDRLCMTDFKIIDLQIGVSFSADPIHVQNLSANRFCLDADLTFDQITFQSEDLLLNKEQNQITLVARPGQFWDVTEPRQINFQLKPFLKTDDVL